MSNVEKIPLLSTTKRFHHSNSNREEDIPRGYLLLSVPQTEDTSIVQKLRNCGNYAGVIVAISITVIVFILIVGITYHADVSDLTVTVTNNSNGLKKSSPPNELSAHVVCQTHNMEIETPLGRLKGHIRRSRKGRDYISFYKVPYAKPPIGELRFMDPQPVERWDGIRDLTEVGPSCIQKSKHVVENIASGEEDCLYSNIYIPHTTGNDCQKLPVMGFGDGDGSRFGAEYFMDEDVVLITFEYRLGLFVHSHRELHEGLLLLFGQGFLNTGDREATGNMGFKDQVMFLKWTKENIRYFNGDPGRVTIFGNSVGGFSVSFQMISPMANGLFHRAISQSGTVLCESTLIFDLHPELTKKAAAEAFNCSLETSEIFLKCLRTIPAADLALAHLKSPDIKYALTVEHGFDQNNLTNVFMPDKPYNLLKAGKVNRVPYIMVIVSTEWISSSLSVLKNVEFTKQLNINFSQFAPELLGMELTPEESDTIKSFYFQNNPINNETERNLTNLISDRVMVHGTKVTADFHSKLSETYLYYLSKRPAKSYSDKVTVDFPSLNITSVVSHADELQFQFPYYGYPQYSVRDMDYFPFSEFFVKLWAQFAATGKPRIEGRLTDWKPLNSADPDQSAIWYELNDFTGVTTVLNQRMRFWDQHSHKKLMYEV